MKRTLFSIALLVAATTASAESWTYRGTLNDGGKLANGSYDVRLTLLNEAKSASISGPVTFPSVKVVDGSFAVDVDFGIDLSNAPVMSLKTEVKQGASGYVALGEPTRFDPKAAMAGICWDTTGNATISPATEFVGTPSNNTLVMRSGNGVSVNYAGQLDFYTDFRISPKSSGDADVDVDFATRNGKTAHMVIDDASGIVQYISGATTAYRNGGDPVHAFDGRLRSYAAGNQPGDTSGGMWMDDERSLASYVGRGVNLGNWTGIYSADAAWTALSTDDGAFMINRVPPLDPSVAGADLVIGARPVGGDADSDLVWETRSNKRGSMTLFDGNGSFLWKSANLGAASAFLIVGNGASLSHGGTWTNASSRSLKTGFAAINPLEMLSKVVALPITSWVYKSSEEGTHVGPVAEDFKAAFGLAGDGKSISTVDADGVALAAIQGLNLKLETENAALKTRLDALEAKFK